MMTEASLAPNLPQWMRDHTDRYLSSVGTDGHMYTINRPGAPALTVPSLLLITTGRKSGKKYIFPLFYGSAGNSYFVIASKGGAPEHPGWYRNLMANPDVEIQVGTLKTAARARTAITGSTVTSKRSSMRASRMFSRVIRFIWGHRLHGRTNSVSGAAQATLSAMEHSVISTTCRG